MAEKACSLESKKTDDSVKDLQPAVQSQVVLTHAERQGGRGGIRGWGGRTGEGRGRLRG